MRDPGYRPGRMRSVGQAGAVLIVETGWQERWRRKSSAISEQRRANKGKDRAALQAAGFSDGQHPLDKQAAMVGLSAVGRATPNDRMAQGALGGIVSGFNARASDEAPESDIERQQVATGLRRARTIPQ